jgi:hypothetical protein
MSVYSLFVAGQRSGKHVPASTKNCWRRRFLCGPCRIKEKGISSSQNFLLFVSKHKFYGKGILHMKSVSFFLTAFIQNICGSDKSRARCTWKCMETVM